MELDDYHVVQDQKNKGLYVELNNTTSKVLHNDKYYKNYKRTANRKSIDTFANAHDKRFDTIEKNPPSLTSCKKVLGRTFDGMKDRTELFP